METGSFTFTTKIRFKRSFKRKSVIEHTYSIEHIVIHLLYGRYGSFFQELDLSDAFSVNLRGFEANKP